MADHSGRAYVPAAGKHWRLPFYDLLAKALGVAAAFALAACAPCPIPRTQPAPRPSPAPFQPSRVEPSDTGLVDEPMDTARIIEVEVHTTQEGASGKFAPEVVRARQGDVLRFRMTDGLSIHNVSSTFITNDTRGAPLPPDGPFLAQKGQSWQMRIDLPPGRYEFGCIPHAATGERGVLIVEG